MSYFISIDEKNINGYHITTNSDKILIDITRSINSYYASKDLILKAYALGTKQGNFLPDDSNIFYKKVVTNTRLPIGFHLDISSHYAGTTQKFLNTSKSLEIPNHNMPVLPIATRYVTKEGIYYIERPPFKVTVDFHKSHSTSNRSNISNLEIWIPWTIMSINPQNIYDTFIFFSPNKLENDQSLYIKSPLPNTYDNGRICFANSLHSLDVNNVTDQNGYVDVRQLYSLIINDYIGGGWNTDLNSCLGNLYSFSVYVKEKEYPMLYKFLNISEEKLRKAFPKLRSSTIKSLTNNPSDHYYSTYRKMFYTFSTMSLEETLQFYSELIEFYKKTLSNSYCYTFSSLMKNVQQHKSAPKKQSLLSNSILNSMKDELSYDNSGQLKRCIIVIENYHNNQKIIDTLSTHFGARARLYAFIEPDTLNKIILDLLHNQNNQHVTPVYIVDIESNTYKVVQCLETPKYPVEINGEVPLMYHQYINNYVVENYTKPSTPENLEQFLGLKVENV